MKIIAMKNRNYLTAGITAATVFTLSLGASADDSWKYSPEAAKRQLEGLDLVIIGSSEEPDQKYKSDGESVNWRDKDAYIEDDLITWDEIDTFKRVPPIIDEAREQAQKIGSGNNPYKTYDDVSSMPSEVSPWWDQEILKPLGRETAPENVSPESLILRAVQNSSQIKVFADVPVIRETAELSADRFR